MLYCRQSERIRQGARAEHKGILARRAKDVRRTEKGKDTMGVGFGRRMHVIFFGEREVCVKWRKRCKKIKMEILRNDVVRKS
ncbi:uncharacterized protein MONOS_13346 [Monocercomonoides exilis]|uniref:uncharacterized protein n=1 Tax=Monocercomonoides exilis TaxID=2049356 RepID=UPI003559FA47|nr:hypothetical protein MONOS_13346 [Monocercomonoides exilis]|eukprot:MONOS_13346.1-p1 / transcript=MONOS_13346.1 / gene=MONOS_13346 / organism=Monocercomonoides_exilis_PA203 / gene_product=unspecified product / transcript_product=unspecified product / location=Mono_scaffold00813:17414-17659(+) / protein_length=82 / sequence_SO=supercontig / SO=protein_coding / is_pseudo=false